MAICDFETGQMIEGVLKRGDHGKKYALIIERLSSQEIGKIRHSLDRRIDSDEIHTAGWIPGSNWEDTPYQPIYEKAARRNYDVAAMMFGLMVWEAFERHPDIWYTGRFEKDGKDIGSRTYFRARS